jgi:hypothetical protein
MVNRLLPPVLTRRRIWLACATAVLSDGIQLVGGLFGLPGWVLDDGVDVVAMVLQCYILGFHPLFLPTFLVKAVPIVDMLPTWTGCTLVVIALRRKQQEPAPNPSPAPPRMAQDVIDI